jgi:hypothetical protein
MTLFDNENIAILIQPQSYSFPSLKDAIFMSSKKYKLIFFPVSRFKV